MKNIGILSLLFLLVFASCRQDSDTIKVTEETPDIPLLENYEPRAVSYTHLTLPTILLV